MRSIPDVMAFRDGKPAAHFLGAQPESQVRAFIDKLLEAADNEARLAQAQRLIDLGRAGRGRGAARRGALRRRSRAAHRGAARRDPLSRAPAPTRASCARRWPRTRRTTPRASRSRAPTPAAKRYREALDELLEIVARDKEWDDGAARKQILNIFNLAEGEPELVADYRRKLARALY